jgi:F-type H+-transporting ATPase subunit gamma
MAGLKELRTRLNAVKSTKKITTAMKLVAAARLKKAVSALERNSAYALVLKNAVARVLLEYQKEEREKKVRYILPSILKAVPNPQNYLLAVFSSERGLCGGYNQNVAKTAAQRIKELTKAGKNVCIVCYGKKAYDVLKKNYASLIVYHEASFASGGIFYQEAVQMLEKIMNFSKEKSFDVCEIVHGHFESAAHHEIISMRLYPLEAEKINKTPDLDCVGDAYFDYKPSKEEVIEQAAKKLLINNVYRAMLGAEASEQSARMLAMENATQNALNMTQTLTLKYNTLRQSAITTELNEIISGAEAL